MGFFSKTNGTNGNGHEILPDEVFIDSSNLPLMDAEQFEGRAEHPVSRFSFIFLGAVFTLALVAFGVRMFDLQVLRGAVFAEASKENRLSQTVVFAERGILYDRTGKELAWNTPGESTSTTTHPTHALRAYSELPGLAHMLGFVRYPKTDKAGAWWRTELVGAAGAEQIFDDVLAGENGEQIVEVDALGATIREQLIAPATNGENINLSIDAELQSALHTQLAQHADIHGFTGGASVIMDVRTGEILALTSFPEYQSQALTDGNSEVVSTYAQSEDKPFLNRAVSGQYTPGSIIKPIFSTAALSEEIIDPGKQILSTGSISIPNPFVPGDYSVFLDWRAHGWVDAARALAVSSNVYFFSIGGGYQDQAGLGIDRLEEWAHAFGLGRETGVALQGEAEGVIPTPRWKEEVFDGEVWRIGDTYNTVIGQYGFQVTPIQAARMIAAIANDGELLEPHLVKGAQRKASFVSVDKNALTIVREGMRRAVSDSDGTARALSFPNLDIAAKTGTAQVGNKNQWMHSWVVGFWPAENPRYAFATVLEEASAGTLAGAAPAMRPFFDWLALNRGEYAEVN